MSRNEPVEILVAVHFNSPERLSVGVSIDGDARHTKFIPKQLIETFDLTGKTTKGVDRGGYKVEFPLANLVIPEWLAMREELI